MEVVVNGERRRVTENLTIRDLLSELEIAADRVAVERNRVIVPRREWERVLIEAGDEVEIVHFVGGG